uniref:NADH dehydrogenase subunit 1 n=1 Tax=Spelaeomysis bottazzii TaxID=2970448 RepID=UPI002176DC8D|nr:NADH dehydrogenase subunit 1 [Spelaeomysis bottazzii]UUL70719.1 NADH dehydrogenase subunit 1 [Spelaeomysis bottazzii]
MFFELFSFIFLVIFILLGVAFVTLMERKVLGSIQIRLGPDKLGFEGFLQPFSDAIKLFFKEQNKLSMVNYFSYCMGPVIMLVISMVLWTLFPFSFFSKNMNLSIFLFFVILSLSVYSGIISGWSSNCKYSFLGILRLIAQTLSYEVSFAIITLSFVYMIMSMSFTGFSKVQEYIWFFIFGVLMMMWFISSLAELNRTPFDFSEGESELVSGFNTEYMGAGFALIFMSEYMMILFMSMMFCLIFLGGYYFSMFFYMKFIFVVVMYIWVRGTLPRMRYDYLMSLTWKIFLPVSLNFLFFNFIMEGLNSLFVIFMNFS